MAVQILARLFCIDTMVSVEYFGTIAKYGPPMVAPLIKIYHGITWYTMELHGIPWYFVTLHGIAW